MLKKKVPTISWTSFPFLFFLSCQGWEVFYRDPFLFSLIKCKIVPVSFHLKNFASLRPFFTYFLPSSQSFAFSWHSCQDFLTLFVGWNRALFLPPSLLHFFCRLVRLFIDWVSESYQIPLAFLQRRGDLQTHYKVCQRKNSPSICQVSYCHNTNRLSKKFFYAYQQ